MDQPRRRSTDLPEDRIDRAITSFERLVLFVKRQPKASLGTLVVLFLTVGLSLMSYAAYLKIVQVSAQTQKNATQLQQMNPTRDQLQELLRLDVKNNTTIHTLLDKVIAVGGDRAYVMKFHNGSRDLNGTHFMYISTTNEVTKPGIANAMAQVQDIPTAMFESKWIEKFLNNECIGVSQDGLDKGTPMHQLMSRLGIVQMQICPIYDVEKNYLLGLSGVSWVQKAPTESEDERTDDELEKVNLALAALLSPVDETAPTAH